MILKFMQLGENFKTKENNEKDTWEDISKKVNEESRELQEAIYEEDLMHIAEETFDLIQVAIRSLVILSKSKLNIEQLNIRHNKKLVNRSWKAVRVIKVFWSDRE